MPNPSSTRQLLLQHQLLPTVSLASTHAADVLIQQCCDDDLASTLQLIKPYGNNAKYSLPNQIYRVTNAHLISKAYGSFPVRFLPSLPELLLLNPSLETPHNLFKVPNLDAMLNHHRASESPPPDLYTSLFRMVIASNRIVPFDTLNHPVSHVFVVDPSSDTVDLIRQLIAEFRNYNFPKYFNLQDVLFHIFVLYDTSKVTQSEIAQFQTDLKSSISVTSTAFPVSYNSDMERIAVFKWENVTVDEELQKFSLLQSSKGKDLLENHLQVPTSVDSALKSGIYDFIAKSLIPHMELKIRHWDDQILFPKKSITGRFFSVSKKLFLNSSESPLSGASTGGSSAFNYQHNFYHKTSPEQVIRKLADWSLILNDFKYAYSTYDLIKKDYTNDKAWVYVASTQEMCIISLLLAQTQPLSSDVNPQPPDRATLRKIRHDIIEPYMDNLSYTFKSRLNVKTYVIRAYFVVSELLLNMSTIFNIPWWWSDLIESYLQKCISEVESGSSAASQRNFPAIKAVIFERLGYVSQRSCFIPGESRPLVESLQYHALHPKPKSYPENSDDKEAEEDLFVNVNKIQAPTNNSTKGLTRYRKSSLWYLLAMKSWTELDDYKQAKNVVGQLADTFDVNLTDNWYDREDLILGKIKRAILVEQS